jgi:hypothetical protein
LEFDHAGYSLLNPLNLNLLANDTTYKSGDTIVFVLTKTATLDSLRKTIRQQTLTNFDKILIKKEVALRQNFDDAVALSDEKALRKAEAAFKNLLLEYGTIEQRAAAWSNFLPYLDVSQDIRPFQTAKILLQSGKIDTGLTEIENGFKDIDIALKYRDSLTPVRLLEQSREKWQFVKTQIQKTFGFTDTQSLPESTPTNAQRTLSQTFFSENDAAEMAQKMGKTALKNALYSDADSFFRRADSLFRFLVKKDTPQYRRAFAENLMLRAQGLTKWNAMEKAKVIENLYIEAIDLLQVKPFYKHQLVNCHETLGLHFRRLKKSDKAEVHLSESLQLLENLVERSATTFELQLAQRRYDLALLKLELNDLSTAQKLIRPVEDVFRKYMPTDTTNTLMEALIHCSQLLGDAYVQADLLYEAANKYEGAARYAKKLAMKTPSVYHPRYSQIFFQLIDIHGFILEKEAKNSLRYQLYAQRTDTLLNDFCSYQNQYIWDIETPDTNRKSIQRLTDVYSELSFANLHRRDPRTAEIWAQKAISLNGDCEPAKLYLAFAQALQNDKNKDKTAKTLLQTWQTTTGKQPEAIHLMKKLNNIVATKYIGGTDKVLKKMELWLAEPPLANKKLESDTK